MLTAAIAGLAWAQASSNSVWYSNDLLLQQMSKWPSHEDYPSKWFLHDRSFTVVATRIPDSVRELADLNVMEALGDRVKVTWTGRHTAEKNISDVVVGTVKYEAETWHLASSERVLTVLIEGKRTTTLPTSEDAMRFTNSVIERVIHIPPVIESQLTHTLTEKDSNLFTGGIYRRARRIVEDDGRIRHEGDLSFGGMFHVATNGKSVLVVAVLPSEGGQQGMYTGPHRCSFVPRS